MVVKLFWAFIWTPLKTYVFLLVSSVLVLALVYISSLGGKEKYWKLLSLNLNSNVAN